MIVLDTNVLSAAISAVKVPKVLKWLDAQVLQDVWITSITVFEVRMGIECLPEGRKRHVLEEEFQIAVGTYLSDRVLPFETVAAHQAGVLFAKRQRLGRPMDYRDAQLAGIVLLNDATLATRDIRDFEHLGIPLINPWTA